MEMREPVKVFIQYTHLVTMPTSGGLYIQGVAVSDRTYFGIYASKYYGMS